MAQKNQDREPNNQLPNDSHSPDAAAEKSAPITNPHDDDVQAYSSEPSDGSGFIAQAASSEPSDGSGRA